MSSYFQTFTRNEYDKGTYKLDLEQSENVGNYILSKIYSHPKEDSCYQPNAEYYGQDQQLDITKENNMVNVESDLYNLNRKISKNPKKQYPFVKGKKDYPKLATCNDKLVTKYSRLEGPTFKRGLAYGDVNFETPILNPQLLKRIHSNRYIGENTYLQDVDNYKVQKIKPMDMKKTYPSKEQLSKEKYSKLK